MRKKFQVVVAHAFYPTFWRQVQFQNICTSTHKLAQLSSLTKNLSLQGWRQKSTTDNNAKNKI